ncbi:MAG: hypothetical protein ACRYF5_01725, partial [Janthinobacterium lividum]
MPVLRNQPQGIVKIDPLNSLTKGLISAITPSNLYQAIIGSSVVIKPGRDHLGNPALEYAQVGSSTSASNVYIPLPATTGNEWTFLGIGYSPKSPSYEALLDFNDGDISPTYRASLQTGTYGGGNVGTDSRPYKPDFNSAAVWPTNRRNIVILTYSATTNALKMYMNRQQIASDGMNTSAAMTIKQIQLFSKGGSGSSNSDPASSASISLAAVWNRAISADEANRLHDNPWQIFLPPPKTTYRAASTGPVDNPVNPGPGSLALAGYAPVISRGATQTVAPGSGVLSIAGYQPAISVSMNTAVAPGIGLLALAGYAPTITRSAAAYIQPDSGVFALTGYPPDVGQSDYSNSGDYEVAAPAFITPRQTTSISSQFSVNTGVKINRLSRAGAVRGGDQLLSTSGRIGASQLGVYADVLAVGRAGFQHAQPTAKASRVTLAPRVPGKNTHLALNPASSLDAVTINLAEMRDGQQVTITTTQDIALINFIPAISDREYQIRAGDYITLRYDAKFNTYRTLNSTLIASSSELPYQHSGFKIGVNLSAAEYSPPSYPTVAEADY